MFRPCSTCKKTIALGSRYYVCNVSTCNGARTGLVFCSVDCWDAHVPTMRHKDAWAEERTAPMSKPAADGESAASGAAAGSGPSAAAPRKINMGGSPPAPRAASGPPKDILIVASKLKAYIRARADMNTSGDVMEILSDRVRALCDAAIEQARNAGRKTVMERDF